MTKIALIHVHSFYNAGDAALTQTAEQNLQEHFPDSQITLLMNDPASYQGNNRVVASFLTWMQRPGRYKPIRFAWLLLASWFAIVSRRLIGQSWYLPWTAGIQPALEVILDADLVVSTPGGYLYRYGGGRTLLILLATFFIVLWAKKPLYLLPQSYGPFSTRLERHLASTVFKHSRLVMAREAISLGHLSECGFPADKCVLLPDMAFAFKSASSDQAEELLTRLFVSEGRPRVGVTAINWGDQYPGFNRQKAYEQAIATSLHYFVQRHSCGQVILFPQCWGPSEHEDDRIPSKRIARELSDLGVAVTVVNSPLAPDLLSAAFGQMDILIGTRMHSNIFALSHQVPVIAVGYLHKHQGIAELVGIPDWVCDIREIDSDRLTTLLDALWDQREALKAHLATVIPGLIAQAHMPGHLIAQDYQKHKAKDNR
jgi:colanic acid/amylovoran biosynthesis protein